MQLISGQKLIERKSFQYRTALGLHEIEVCIAPLKTNTAHNEKYASHPDH